MVWNKYDSSATLCTTHLHQSHKTVDVAVESAAVQGGPGGLLVLCHQVRALAVQQPLQQGTLTKRGSQVQRRAAETITQRGRVVAVGRQEGAQSALLRAAGHGRHDLVGMLSWAAFRGAIGCCSHAHGDLKNTKDKLSPKNKPHHPSN